jgi:hypothetical protein
VSGNRDPQYLDTSRMVLEAALCLALQHAELKEKGFLQARRCCCDSVVKVSGLV